MNNNDSSIILFLIFILIIVSLTQSPKSRIQNKGVVQFEPFIPENTTQPIHTTIQYDNNVDVTIQSKKSTEVPPEFSEAMFLPTKFNDDGISLKKPEIDIRDISIDNWRNDKNQNQKNQNQILSDLREFQQNVNEPEQNKYKSMSVEEHRKQSIQEWHQRVKQHTQESQSM